MDNQYSDYIYRPLGDKGPNPDLEALPTKQEGYTVGQSAEGCNILIDVESPKCHAKIVLDQASGRLTPFIKFGTFGASADWPYDPFDPNVREGDGGKRGMKDGRGLYEFRKVSQETFTNYLLFLKTGNKKWLHHARRSRD